MLSQYVEVSYADDLLADRAGAVGYLLKDRVAEVADFLDALNRVAAGGTVLDPEVVGQLVVRRGRTPLDSLTPREREVLSLMAEGRSNTAIARQLVVTDGAVEKHVKNIFTKLDSATGRGAASTGPGGADLPPRLSGSYESVRRLRGYGWVGRLAPSHNPEVGAWFPPLRIHRRPRGGDVSDKGSGGTRTRWA